MLYVETSFILAGVPTEYPVCGEAQHAFCSTNAGQTIPSRFRASFSSASSPFLLVCDRGARREPTNCVVASGVTSTGVAVATHEERLLPSLFYIQDLATLDSPFYVKMAAPNVLKCCRNLPLVVVLGATGTGKSKLAIEIASKFNGEIISADSMQVYKSLDIITNKVTQAERDAAPHHLLDFLDPLSNFTVADFQSKALGVINNLANRNKLPIIVGGTNYYIESLLWKILVRPEKEPDDQLTFDSSHVLLKDVVNSFLESETNIDSETSAAATTLLSDKANDVCLGDVSTEHLYKCLKIVDPERAVRLHPKDRRKIERSLQVFQVHGRPHSDIIEEQQQMEGGSSLGGPLRFQRPCVLWLQCDQNVLDERLDARVDDMIAAGLIEEMEEFHERYNKHRIDHNLEADYTKGIFQSIGFKEFHQYLLMSSEEKVSPKGQKEFAQG
ncbi:hypothetical protein HPB50_025552 [Hyalomma asiaticum]|uniref:Uncharacterized protein n=1 Tax=Hyalomma asiaticum TaxID=266040 RepID=A0ACB7RMY0_HYAAI|nr:hypothetical protein HPB50_025552 [Hyalomma asiaticum]